MQLVKNELFCSTTPCVPWNCRSKSHMPLSSVRGTSINTSALCAVPVYRPDASSTNHPFFSTARSRSSVTLVTFSSDGAHLLTVQHCTVPLDRHTVPSPKLYPARPKCTVQKCTGAGLLRFCVPEPNKHFRSRRMSIWQSGDVRDINTKCADC
jgi:hypothetical protein